jgi:hypothetical protein
VEKVIPTEKKKTKHFGETFSFPPTPPSLPLLISLSDTSREERGELKREGNRGCSDHPQSSSILSSFSSSSLHSQSCSGVLMNKRKFYFTDLPFHWKASPPFAPPATPTPVPHSSSLVPSPQWGKTAEHLQKWLLPHRIQTNNVLQVEPHGGGTGADIRVPCGTYTYSKRQAQESLGRLADRNGRKKNKETFNIRSENLFRMAISWFDPPNHRKKRFTIFPKENFLLLEEL